MQNIGYNYINDKEVAGMTEREKMVSSKPYDPSDPELAEARLNVRRLVDKYNSTRADEQETRSMLLDQILGSHGEDPCMEPSVRFDYGKNTSVGDNFFANFNTVILDCAPVTIGNNVMFGPNVTIATPMHPLLARERNIRVKEDGTKYNLEYALPIKICDNVWLASGVCVTGGVTIGEGSVIGAGSVVTRDIPAGVVAAGVPCRVLRSLSEEDAMGLYDD